MQAMLNLLFCDEQKCKVVFHGETN